MAKEIFQRSNERPPDLGAPLDCYAQGTEFKAFHRDPSRSANSPLDFAIADIGEGASVIPIVTTQHTLQVIDAWMLYSEPFILIGPEGCG